MDELTTGIDALARLGLGAEPNVGGCPRGYEHDDNGICVKTPASGTSTYEWLGYFAPWTLGGAAIGVIGSAIVGRRSGSQLAVGAGVGALAGFVASGVKWYATPWS